MRHLKSKVAAAATCLLSAAGLSMAAPVAAQASGSIQICNMADPSNSAYCMNRQGDGTANGTHVIAYSQNDGNNDFQFATIGGMCNGGHVTTTCPFTVGSGLNNAYNGDSIVQIYSPTSNTCVGTPSSTTFFSELTGCQNQSGKGGGWSTIDVVQHAVTSGGINYNIIINVHWSDELYTAFPESGCGTGEVYGCSQNLIQDGFRNQIYMAGGDSGVQSGFFADASGASQWAQFSL